MCAVYLHNLFILQKNTNYVNHLQLYGFGCFWVYLEKQKRYLPIFSFKTKI
jgi:hypothetical protein